MEKTCVACFNDISNHTQGLSSAKTIKPKLKFEIQFKGSLNLNFKISIVYY